MSVRWFVTADGVRVPAISSQQMREIDRAAIEGAGPNIWQMMENAGRSLALTAMDMVGAEWRSTPIVVLAGNGGNGGGGICAARHLADRGANVSVAIGDPSMLSPAPAQQLAIYRATPGRLAPVDSLDSVEAGLVVDALIGYGIHGAPRGATLTMMRWATDSRAPILSLDVPSGIDATTGSAPGEYLQAARSLTLALPKTGLDAPSVGDLWLADLGIPTHVYREVGIDVPAVVFGDRFRVRLTSADG